MKWKKLLFEFFSIGKHFSWHRKKENLSKDEKETRDKNIVSAIIWCVFSVKMSLCLDKWQNFCLVEDFYHEPK